MGRLRQAALQRPASVYQRHSQQLACPLCREARLEVTAGRAGGVESNGRKMLQLFNAAAAYSDAHTERHDDETKPKP